MAPKEEKKGTTQVVAKRNGTVAIASRDAVLAQAEDVEETLKAHQRQAKEVWNAQKRSQEAVKHFHNLRSKHYRAINALKKMVAKGQRVLPENHPLRQEIFLKNYQRQPAACWRQLHLFHRPQVCSCASSSFRAA